LLNSAITQQHLNFVPKRPTRVDVYVYVCMHVCTHTHTQYVRSAWGEGKC